MDGHPVSREIRDVNAPLTEEEEDAFYFIFKAQKINIGDIVLYKEQNFKYILV